MTILELVKKKTCRVVNPNQKKKYSIEKILELLLYSNTQE